MQKIAQRVLKKGWLVENLLFLPAVGIIAALLAYWAFILDRIPPVEFFDGKPEPAAVRPGDTITIHWRFKKRRAGSCSAVVSREIVDSTRVVWWKEAQQVNYSVFPEEEEAMGLAIVVPFGAAWGSAHYHFRACFECAGASFTAMFPICVVSPEVRFEVLPPKQ